MSIDAAGVAAPAPVQSRAGASLTRRASLTAIAALLDYSAKLAVGLLVTPILVHGLGRAVYGMWEMLQQLIGYMSAADGRPTDALRLVIANRQETDDAAARRRQVGAALVVWVLFLPLIVALGSIAVWLAPTITHAAPAQHGAVRLAAGLLVLSFVAATLAAVPEAVLRGMNLGYKRMGWQAGLSITGGLLLAAAVTAGFGLPGLGGAQVGLFVLTGLCFWVLARRYVADFGVARPTRAEVKSLVGMSVWLALGDLISKLLLASDVIILGMVVSPTVVTSYVLTGYAARTANGVLFFTIGSAMPGIGGLVGQQQYDRAATLRGELLALTWLFAIGVGSAVLAWNPSFLGLWVGGENYAGAWVNLLVVCVMTQTMFIRSDSYLIDVALKPRLRVIVGAVAAAVTIGAGIPLTRAFGIVGLCAGILVGRATQSIAYPLIAAACLKRPARIPWRPLLRPLTATALVFGAAAALGSRVVAPGWVLWGLGVLATAAVAPFVALSIGLPAPARQAVLARMRDIARAVRG